MKGEPANFVHGDIKPLNLILTDSGVKLIDFGQSDLANPFLGPHGGGTPAYMAPELWERTSPTSPRSDQYALGVTLFQMLTGQPPYQTSNLLEYGRLHCGRDVPDPLTYDKGLPPECTHIVRKAMAKAPGDRYQTAAAFRQDLIDALERHGEASTRTATPRNDSPRSRTLRLAAGAVALAFLGLGAVVLPTFFKANRDALSGNRPAVVDATAPRPQPPVSPLRTPFHGKVDVMVERTDQGGAVRLLRLNEAGALPLGKTDKFRIEGQVDPPAYLYVVWVDPGHDVTPVYPWDPRRGWGSRPEKEEPGGRVSLPSNAAMRYTAPEAKPGVATMVLLARTTPLDVPDDVLRKYFEQLPDLPLPPGGEQAVVWFDNYVEVQDPDRPRTFDVVGTDNPFARWQGQLQERLGDKAAFQTAVSFARTGPR
jgi:hypothetical protein